VAIEFEVSADVAERVHALAERRGVTVSALIASIMTDYLANV
jgi:predicted transcriptional regulator